MNITSKVGKINKLTNILFLDIRYYLWNMKKNEARYENVVKLAKNAMTVKKYADSIPISTSHVYKLYNQGKLKIVVFQGVNFVIPKT